MKPGDLVRLGETSSISIYKEIPREDLYTEARQIIMTVINVRPETRDLGWDFCTSGRGGTLAVDVLVPGIGLATLPINELEIISDDHTSLHHAKLTALAFGGAACSTSPESDCNG